MTFETLGMSQELLGNIQKLGFAEPTQIQEQSIPAIIDGKDIIGESATGSGKTLAFGAGIVERCQPGKGLQALVMTPTRELAEQVCRAIRELTRTLKLTPIYGGVALDPQAHALQTTDVVVATPGRLLDHMERGNVDLSGIKLLVLDEADRMLDMGFIDDVERIIRACPKDRQTLFFSATITREIDELAGRYMHDPVDVTAVKMVDPDKLEQIYFNVPRNQKISLLVHLLKNEHSSLVMVFCNTRHTTDFVVRNLQANDINATAIHGGLSQNKRSRTMEKFNSAKTEVLVCTDVAARGLHINDVSHVYNYEVPNDQRDYVHRIGRTARAGKEGIVMNLIAPNDHENFGRVKREYPEFVIALEETPKFSRARVKLQDDRNDRGGGHGGFRGARGGGNRQGARSGGRGGKRPKWGIPVSRH